MTATQTSTPCRSAGLSTCEGYSPWEREACRTASRGGKAVARSCRPTLAVDNRSGWERWGFSRKPYRSGKRRIAVCMSCSRQATRTGDSQRSQLVEPFGCESRRPESLVRLGIAWSRYPRRPGQPAASSNRTAIRKETIYLVKECYLSRFPARSTRYSVARGCCARGVVACCRVDTTKTHAESAGWVLQILNDEKTLSRSYGYYYCVVVRIPSSLSPRFTIYIHQILSMMILFMFRVGLTRSASTSRHHGSLACPLDLLVSGLWI